MSSDSDTMFNICDALITAVADDDVAKTKKKKKKTKRQTKDKNSEGGVDPSDYGEEHLLSLDEEDI
jgi:2C-methyl-D-erythritol 2,4-cyclodiphosphate synthase